MSDSPVTALHAADSGRDALAELSELPGAVAPVLDGPGGRLVGTASDVGLRRLARAGADLDGAVTGLLDPEPVTVAVDADDSLVRERLRELGRPAVVVVDGDRPVAVRTAADVGLTDPPTAAVVLAGGRGQRLAPLTDKVPKPLLTVGRTTIVERLLQNLASAGVIDVWLAVNYKAEVFEERLGDGQTSGVRLGYLRERKPLHTAGPLSLLPAPPAGPLLVANADQVTALDLARLLEFHRAEGAAMTVGAFEHSVQVPYGVLRLGTEGRVVGVDEKPVLRSACNAGLYVVEPDVVRLVPRNTYYGMPDLIGAVLAAGGPVAAFPIIETFIDIGTREELDRALVWFATGEEV